MKNNSNKYYVCKDHYLLIYETKEDAIATGVRSFQSNPKSVTSYWTNEFDTRVTYSNPGEPIFLLNVVPGQINEEYWHVIIGEKVGWIFGSKYITPLEPV